MRKLVQLEECVAITADAMGAPASPENATLIERLYHSHARDLCRYLAARFGLGPPEPEEVAQVAFARLAAAPEIGRIANPRSYLYTIACNIVLDHRRRAAHRDAVHRQLSAQEEGNAASELSPEHVLLAQERFAVFQRALKAMPAMRRRIFLLVRAEGLPVSAIAVRFGISENAVHKHVSRALQDCAALFESIDSPPGSRP